MRLRALAVIGLLTTVAACSGGGGARVPGGAQTQAAAATGTLSLSFSQNGSANRRRKPAYVSVSTADATLFIDGAASGFRVACAPYMMPTRTCTINWTSTSGTHTFVAEVDDGHNVLAEGSATYTLAGGSNGALAPMTLVGVAAKIENVYGSASSTCSGPNAGCVTGTYAVMDAGANFITTPGATYDNGPLSVGAGAGSTAAFSDSFTNLSGPDSVGNDYQYSVSCASGASGSFTLAFTPHASSPPAGELTAAELATYSLAYPSTVALINWPSAYTCTNGTISIGSGSPSAPAAGTVYVLSNYTAVESFAPSAGANATPLLTFGSSALGSVTGIAVDATGTVYGAAATGAGGFIYAFPYNAYKGGGTVSPSATITSDPAPWGLAIDPSGNVVATDYRNYAVYFFAPGASGNATPVKTIAGTNTQINYPYQAALDGSGNLYVLNAGNNTITVYSASSISGIGTLNPSPIATISSSSTGIDSPEGLAVDSNGQMYVANSQNDTVTVFAAGSNGFALPLATLNASFNISQAVIATDASNNLYVDGQNDNVLVYAAVTSSSQSPANTITSSSLGSAFGVGIVP